MNNAYTRYLFEITKNDGIWIMNIVFSQYGYALCYYILYRKSSKIREVVSRKVFKDLDLKIVEPVSKENLLVIEGNYWNTRIFEQVLLLLIVSTTNILICNINNINILVIKIVESTFILYRSLVSILISFL